MSIKLIERLGSLKIFHSPNEFIAFQDLISKDTFVILNKEIRAVRDLLTSLLLDNQVKQKPNSEIEVEPFSYVIQQETN